MIRPAIDADCAAVEAVVAEAYAPYIPRLGRKPGPMLEDYAALIRTGHVHILEEAGTPLGILVLIPETDSLLLDNIAIAPAAQGKGHGRTLLRHAEAAARQQGYQTIRLYTNQAMTENIALYERNNYVETHRVTEKGLHRVYMTKQL